MAQMERQAILDAAVARVFGNENVVKAYRRFGLTTSIGAQILATYRTLALQAERPGA
jgi:hypothetical protein